MNNTRATLCDYADTPTGRCFALARYLVAFSNIDQRFSAFNPFAPVFPSAACRRHALAALTSHSRARTISVVPDTGVPSFDLLAWMAIRERRDV